MASLTLLREVGKLALQLRFEGCLLFTEQVAVTGGIRLFNKNLGLRKVVRPCMEADTCPAVVSQTPVQRNEGPLNGGGNYDPLKVAKCLAA